METLKDKVEVDKIFLANCNGFRNIGDGELTIEDLNTEFNLKIMDYEFKRGSTTKEKNYKDIKIRDLEWVDLIGSKLDASIFKEAYNLI